MAETPTSFRIVLTLTRTLLLQPRLLADLVERLAGRDEIVGVVLLPMRSRHYTRSKFWRDLVRTTGWRGMAQLFRRAAGVFLLDRVDAVWGLARPASLAGIARRHRIPVFIADDVNSASCRNWMRALTPDIIVNSSSERFDDATLAVPRLACVNKHCSLLPAYRGLFPVFWALLNGETRTGVSVHVMAPKLDQGRLLSQSAIDITPADTHFSLLEKCYAASADAIVSALDRLRDENADAEHAGDAASAPGPSRYYSWPTPEAARAYFSRGLRF